MAGPKASEQPRDQPTRAQAPNVPDPPRRHRRWWVLLGAIATAGFVLAVIVSARNSAVPVGASGSSSGISMGTGGQIAVALRDADGRSFQLPGGRPGVLAFVNAAANCQSCVAAVRAAAQALRRAGGKGALTVVSTDPATSRDELKAFARLTAHPPARYVIDDRNGRLISLLGAVGLASLEVYDARGRIVARPEAVAAQLAPALKRAGLRH